MPDLTINYKKSFSFNTFEGKEIHPHCDDEIKEVKSESLIKTSPEVISDEILDKKMHNELNKINMQKEELDKKKLLQKRVEGVENRLPSSGFTRNRMAPFSPKLVADCSANLIEPNKPKRHRTKLSKHHAPNILLTSKLNEKHSSRIYSGKYHEEPINYLKQIENFETKKKPGENLQYKFNELKAMCLDERRVSLITLDSKLTDAENLMNFYNLNSQSLNYAAPYEARQFISVYDKEESEVDSCDPITIDVTELNHEPTGGVIKIRRYFDRESLRIKQMPLSANRKGRIDSAAKSNQLNTANKLASADSVDMKCADFNKSNTLNEMYYLNENLDQPHEDKAQFYNINFNADASVPYRSQLLNLNNPRSIENEYKPQSAKGRPGLPFNSLKKINEALHLNRKDMLSNELQKKLKYQLKNSTNLSIYTERIKSAPQKNSNMNKTEMFYERKIKSALERADNDPNGEELVEQELDKNNSYDVYQSDQYYFDDSLRKFNTHTEAIDQRNADHLNEHLAYKRISSGGSSKFESFNKVSIKKGQTIIDFNQVKTPDFNYRKNQVFINNEDLKSLKSQASVGSSLSGEQALTTNISKIILAEKTNQDNQATENNVDSLFDIKCESALNEEAINSGPDVNLNKKIEKPNVEKKIQGHPDEKELMLNRENALKISKEIESQVKKINQEMKQKLESAAVKTQLKSDLFPENLCQNVMPSENKQTDLNVEQENDLNLNNNFKIENENQTDYQQFRDERPEEFETKSRTEGIYVPNLKTITKMPKIEGLKKNFQENLDDQQKIASMQDFRKQVPQETKFPAKEFQETKFPAKESQETNFPAKIFQEMNFQDNSDQISKKISNLKDSSEKNKIQRDSEEKEYLKRHFNKIDSLERNFDKEIFENVLNPENKIEKVFDEQDFEKIVGQEIQDTRLEKSLTKTKEIHFQEEINQENNISEPDIQYEYILNEKISNQETSSQPNENYFEEKSIPEKVMHETRSNEAEVMDSHVLERIQLIGSTENLNKQQLETASLKIESNNQIKLKVKNESSNTAVKQFEKNPQENDGIIPQKSIKIPNINNNQQENFLPNEQISPKNKSIIKINSKDKERVENFGKNSTLTYPVAQNNSTLNTVNNIFNLPSAITLPDSISNF